MEIDANSQGGARYRYQCIRLICWVQRNASDALMHRVQQERANTCTRKKVFCMTLMSF